MQPMMQMQQQQFLPASTAHNAIAETAIRHSMLHSNYNNTQRCSFDVTTVTLTTYRDYLFIYLFIY